MDVYVLIVFMTYTNTELWVGCHTVHLHFTYLLRLRGHLQGREMLE
jgi:hypothetical protein